MKKFLVIAFSIFVLGFIVFWIYFAYFAPAKSLPTNFCGYWGVFTKEGPTCECEGEIIKKGGPTGPADDSGGYYECNGKIISSKNIEKSSSFQD